MRRPVLAASLASLALFASPVSAGPLSKVARGVENKIETHQDRPSPPSGSPSRPDGERPDPRPDDRVGYYQAGGMVYAPDARCDGCGLVLVRGGGAGTEGEEGDLFAGPGRLDLYLGAHSVVGSDGALVGDVRVSKSWIGLSASGTSYFEEVEGKQASDSVRVDLLSFALNGRILSTGSGSLWIDGGLAANRSSEYETIMGGMVGLRAEQRVLPELGVVAQGRMYRMEADVSALEGWVGVRAWFLGAGYRVLRFNVGPALHGPEAGVALQF